MIRKPQPRPATQPAPSPRPGTMAYLVQQQRAKNRSGSKGGQR